MGDFNVDLTNIDSTTSQASDFVNTFVSYSYNPHINRPTRITNHSATILDNIFYNYSEKVLESGIVTTDISDHLTPFIIIKSHLFVNNINSYYTRRDFSDENMIAFCTKLQLVNWEYLNQIDNVHERYDRFLEVYTKSYNECFPVINIRRKGTVNSKPWLSYEIKKMCKRKYILYKKYIRNPTPYRENVFKRYRNMLHNLIRQKKRQFYDHKFDTVKFNAKATWKIINSILTKNDKKTEDYKIENNGEVIENKYDIANIFNNFFSTIGLQIHEATNNHSGNKEDFKKYMKNTVCQSMYFTPISEAVLYDVVSKLDVNKSAGYDDISAKVVKCSIHAIATPLCNIINFSIEKGVFPNSMKIAKVIPVFKSGNKTSLTNYRPISILSVFSKIFEKIVYNKIISFISKYNILYSKQFGFRQGYSTVHAMIDFTEKIAKSFEDKNITIGIFLDLSKAFDCINHDILVEKLFSYGIRGTVLKWIISYLNNRKQYVCVDKIYSQPADITVGVPQGSNLGPLLFLLYINDIQYASDIFSPILFADDTSLFLSGRDPVQLNHLMNSEMNKIEHWFQANRLKINASKTSLMIFKPKNKKIQDNIIKLYINDAEVTKVQSTKFLGVIIDENLSWKEHVDDITKKISKFIGILNRLKSDLPLRILVNLYNTMILPYLNYCNVVWGNCAIYLIQQLFRLQKRAIRTITNSSYLAHTHKLFLKLKILKISDLHTFQTALFMFSYHRNLLPNIFNNYFISNRNVNKYLTRNADKLYIPFYTHSISRRVISYNGPIVWNNVPSELKMCPSLQSFRKKYKSHLLNSQTSLN